MAGIPYSNEEKFDMLALYLQSHRNADITSARYLEMYPERRQPHKTQFRKIVVNLINHGAFEQPRSGYTENENRNRNILQAVNENPRASVRTVEREIGVSKSTVQRVLAKNKYHPYKPTIVQGLKETDFPRRMRFCEWYTRKCNENPEFVNHVLWSDESRFTNCGVYNKHNTHHWAVENPHEVAERRLQTRFGSNVWCGVIGNLI